MVMLRGVRTWWLSICVGTRSLEGQEGCCSCPLGHATDLVLGLKSWAGLLSRDIPVCHTELLYNVSVFSHQPDRVGDLSQEGLLACPQT